MFAFNEGSATGGERLLISSANEVAVLDCTARQLGEEDKVLGNVGKTNKKCLPSVRHGGNILLRGDKCY